MDSDKTQDLNNPNKKRKSNPSEITSSSNTIGSFSQIDNEKFRKMFNEKYEDIIDRQEVETSKLIEDLLPAPIDLKKTIYKKLVENIGESKYPNLYTPERRNEDIINIYLREVNTYLRSNEATTVSEIGESKVEFKYQERLEISWEALRYDLGFSDIDAAKLRKIISKGSADLILKVTNQSSQLQDEIYFLAVEVKKESYERGIVQCILYLVAAYFGNQVKKPVYGICSDGECCNLIRYDGKIKKIKMRSAFLIIFPRMVEKIYKQKWIDEYSHLADIVYSIFKKYAY